MVRCMKAVQIDGYRGVEVLDVRQVERPEPGPDQVLVAVRAAGVNPSDGTMRAGLVRDLFPLTFPSGQGSDLAGEGGNESSRAASIQFQTPRRPILRQNERRSSALGCLVSVGRPYYPTTCA
jgi:hypothetical protein